MAENLGRVIVHGQHNYQVKLQALSARGKLRSLHLADGNTVRRVDVDHHADCAINRDELCDCDPDIYTSGAIVLNEEWKEWGAAESLSLEPTVANRRRRTWRDKRSEAQ